MPTREDLESYEKFKGLFNRDDARTAYFAIKYDGGLLPVIADVVGVGRSFACKAEVSNDDKSMVVCMFYNICEDDVIEFSSATAPGPEWLPEHSSWREIIEDVNEYLVKNGYLF